MNDIRKRLGRRIRALRAGLNLSQEELAEKAGISAKYLGEVERGVGNISIGRLNGLADVLDIRLTDILETEHELTLDELLAEIARILPTLSLKEAQTAYRILKALKNR
jgi:transcriptional regulator with XRE-family HTH domain